MEQLHGAHRQSCLILERVPGVDLQRLDGLQPPFARWTQMVAAHNLTWHSGEDLKGGTQRCVCVCVCVCVCACVQVEGACAQKCAEKLSRRR